MELLFKEWIINEMPITRFDLVGDWDKDAPQRGYSRQDVGILTNPKAVEKIHRKWSNTDYDFDFYFVRAKNAWKQREIGQVSREFAKEQFGIDVPTKDDKITIIFTNNIGTEKVPMTAWLIAHRMSHSLRMQYEFNQYLTKQVERDFNQLIKDLNVQITPLQLAYNLGTMKSCRERNLLNFGEFIHELFAQYIINGKVTFNKIKNHLILDKKYAWGRPNNRTVYLNLNKEELVEMNEVIENMADSYTANLSQIMGAFYNRIFVM
jgi:hypothetical protein